jgi:hypothetical protein
MKLPENNDPRDLLEFLWNVAGTFTSGIGLNDFECRI